MRLKPRDWFLISLLLFAASICMWQYAEKRASAHRPAQNAVSPTTALPGKSSPKAGTTAAAAAKKSYRISNTSQTVAQMIHNNHAILLRNALIDTEVPVRLSIPDHLRAKSAPGSYLVQADHPLDTAFYAELRQAGVTYISYIPNNTALVKATPDQATNLSGYPDVIVVLPYQPYYKLDSALLPSAVEQQPQTNVLGVTTFPGQRDAALAALTKLGATLVGEDSGPFGPTLIVRAPPASLVDIAQMPLAQEIEVRTPRHLLNDLTRVQMGVTTNTLVGTPSYLNLSGQNVTVNLNDTGVDATHPDLMNRVIPSTSTDDSTGHGTHIAGIIAGNGSKSLTVTQPVPGSITPGADFRGKATNATIFVQILGSESDSSLQMNAAATLGPTNLISNNSWGYDSTSYDTSAASYDAATRDALPFSPNGGQPLLFVFAAGDGGTGSGSINSPGTAKNVITVGATESPRNITNTVTYPGNPTPEEPWANETSSSNTIAPFSGSGNVDVGIEGTYGRFKPDVVAPGVFTISCRASEFIDITNSPTITDYPFPNQTVALGQTNENYEAYVYSDTEQFVLVMSSNVASPTPFPTNLILIGDTGYPPSTILSSNFGPGNPYVLTNFVPGSVLNFGIYDPTNNTQTQPANVSYNLDIYLYETNDYLTNYYFVLSNLNSVLKPWYVYQTGTSMSAGAVSGDLALMQQFLQQDMKMTNPSPALLKAMLINGARTLSPSYDYNVNPSGANEQGWGLPNITNCLPASLTNANPSMILLDQSLSNALATGQYQTYTINCGDANVVSNFPIRFTLVWTDPPGDPAAGIALVNNLDLTVVDNTGTNIFIGNNFMGGDIFTEDTSPTNLPASQSSNTVNNIYVTTNGVANFTAAGDPINNVQNVYINPLTTQVQFPLTVTISGTRVNVNANSFQTTNILQDYALVISSDDPAITNAITITTNPIASLSPALLITPVNSGQPLLHQRVGANEPNLYNFPLGLTNGNSNQWHFFVFTNNQFSATNNATNVAFATFLPPNLSIPRVTGADIDLYVDTNGDDPLTAFPTFVSNSLKSVGRTGTESIVISNSYANQVFYIGVKSEDQQGSDFGFFAVAQQNAFSSGSDNNTTVTATGVTAPPVFIPDATSPQPALVFAFMVNPNPILQDIQRATVSLGILQPAPENLYGTVQFGPDNTITVLNAYSAVETTGIDNTYDDLQEDPASGDIVTDGFADGTGGLNQYVGLNANGLWLLTEADRAIGQSGYVTNFTVTVNLQEPQLAGFILNDFCGQEWYDGYIDVPNDATNLTITATYLNGTGGNIQLYLSQIEPLNFSDYPGPTPYPVDTNTGQPVEGQIGGTVYLTLSTNPPAGWPPLVGGRWYYGIYNPASSGNGCVDLGITNYIQESLTPNLVQSYTNNTFTPLTTDAHTQSEICLTNYAAGTQIVALQVGLLLQDTNLDDLAIHLISPNGTSLMLFEDRGGTNADALGMVETNGGVTNYIYTVFTENTNLTTTPIKFAPPPYASNDIVTNLVIWSNSFETVPAGVYTNGDVLEGWTVTNNVVTMSSSNGPILVTNGEVGIVTDSNNDQVITATVTSAVTFYSTNSLGSNFLALTSGHIIQTFGGTNSSPLFTNAISNGQPYQLVFYARPMGLVDWWPADDSAFDLVGTNDGVPFNIQYDTGEVDRAFTFSPPTGFSTSTVLFGNNAGNFGTNDFTIDFWMKTSLSNNTAASILQKGSFCSFVSNYFGIFLHNGAIVYSQGRDDNSTFFLASTNGLADGVFYHHVAVTCQATNVSPGLTNTCPLISIYIDGQFSAAYTNTYTNVPSEINNTAPLIAGNLEGCTIPFVGDVDELDLEDRALSPAEIWGIYNAGSLGKYSTNSLYPNFQLTVDGIATNTIILSNTWGEWQLITNSFYANSDQLTIEFSGNPLGVLLDDIQLIQMPTTNYDNYYLPEEPMTPFVGENPLGCWTLDIWDTRNDSPLPTNGVLLSWTMQVTTSSTNAILYVLTNDIPLTVTNTNNGMTYFAVDVPDYATDATNMLFNISGTGGPLTVYFDQDALPTGGLPGDVVLTNGITVGSTNVLATLGGFPPLLPGQRYFLGVLNNSINPITYTIEVAFNGLTNSVIPLTNDVPFTNTITNLGSLAADYYSFVVPTNAVMVTFQILNPTNGEVDLYANDGLPLPSTNDFAYDSINAGANDQFIVVTTNSVPVPVPVPSTNDVIPLPASTWYLAAYNSAGATNTNGYTIVASWVDSTELNIIPLANAVFQTNLAVPGYPTNYLYSFTVSDSPAGIDFTVTNTTNFGNVELLVSYDVYPTPEDFYSGSFNPGTNAQFVQIGTNFITTSNSVTTLNGTWYLAVPNTSPTNVPFSIEATEIYTGPVTNAPLFKSASVSPTTGEFSMSFSAVPGKVYEIDDSSNLLNWAFLTNITAESSTVSFTDPTPVQSQKGRFYRISQK